jgi:hypothetical protein
MVGLRMACPRSAGRRKAAPIIVRHLFEKNPQPLRDWGIFYAALVNRIMVGSVCLSG